MKSKDWFVIGMRLLGVNLLINAVTELTYLSEHVSGMVNTRTTTPGAYLFHATVDVLAAGLLLLGAVPFANFFDWDVADSTKPGFPLDAE